MDLQYRHPYQDESEVLPPFQSAENQVQAYTQDTLNEANNGVDSDITHVSNS